MDIKRTIKGVAKTTGKYSLKGIGKGVELTGRSIVKTLNALVKTPGIQKIGTTLGVLYAGVAIPPVGGILVGITALKYMVDRGILGKKRSLLDEINDILGAGQKATKSASDNVLSPALKKMDKGIEKVGKKYQRKIDDIFR